MLLMFLQSGAAGFKALSSLLCAILRGVEAQVISMQGCSCHRRRPCKRPRQLRIG